MALNKTNSMFKSLYVLKDSGRGLASHYHRISHVTKQTIEGKNEKICQTNLLTSTKKQTSCFRVKNPNPGV